MNLKQESNILLRFLLRSHRSCGFTLFYFLFIFNFRSGSLKKTFIEFVTLLLLFYVLVFWPQGMWDLRSLTRD